VDYCLGFHLITKFPPEIGKLVTLKTLKLHFLHNLESLPCEIGNLVVLKKLDLDYCPKLKLIPPEIGRLRSLRDLNLCCEELERPPDEIGQLGAV
jgi:Leucine-rich repeat (LRR) protein